MIHWLAHLFGWNYCRAPRHYKSDDGRWFVGIECVTCGQLIGYPSKR